MLIYIIVWKFPEPRFLIRYNACNNACTDAFAFLRLQARAADSLAADIILTLIVIALGQFIAYKLTVSNCKLSGAGFNIAAALIVIAMLAVFIAFTWYPPHLTPFQGPNRHALRVYNPANAFLLFAKRLICMYNLH